jgi:hypothetical protein
MLDLCGVHHEAGAREVRRALEDGLSQWLQELAQRNPARSVAVIEGLAVGAFYQVRLGLIYQHHASDRRMTVLCTPPSPSLTQALPPPLEYNPLAAQQFYSNLLPADQIVEDIGDGASTS